MRKYLIFCLISFLALIGCKQQEQVSIPEGYYDYEKTEVNERVESLSFESQLPQFLPFQVEFIISDQYIITGTDQEALDISFYSSQNDLLTLQAVDGHFPEDISGESVEINQQISGTYVDNSFAKTLYWSMEGISYKLVFRSGVIDSDNGSNTVTKTELVKVAKSFQA
ncbi:hypothetical protein GCM10011351_09530 [Paraliobacillus quinghaiensis]|uniref:DUF4367 domain-containing protein n=1 Tax=Paraliobacillus quinghaiensis TaxID=470815 RepID=A0A917WSM5_9BACI|nr:hypothetical protein [Paraliobacillus quinghaiensis]GGM25985.1 hypothetical protein GCM10011351_09530 [Paraliobacillus quinghaiensis]